MENFLDKLLNIRSGFFGRMKLLFIFDLIAVSSIFYAIFIILNVEYFLGRTGMKIPVPIQSIPPALAFIIAAACALLLHKKDRRINVCLLIERKYPELKEKLRTAYDNRNETNIIVDSLKTQVSEALNRVSSSEILTTGKMLARLLITIVFIAGMVTISSNPEKYSIPVETIDNIADTLTGADEEGTNATIDVVGRPEDLDKAGKEGGGELIGKPKIASIEGKNIDLTVEQGMESGYEVLDASRTQNQFMKSAAFPVDVLGSNVSDGGYSILMKKTETEKELINKYAVERSKI